MPKAKVVVKLPGGNRVGTADAKGIFRIPVGTIKIKDIVEIFVTGLKNGKIIYQQSKGLNVGKKRSTKEYEKEYLKDAQNMKPKE